MGSKEEVEGAAVCCVCIPRQKD